MFDPGVCEIGGCLDSNALNYDPEATYSNGLCAPPQPGCIDSIAYNFRPSARTDDGSCMYRGCTDTTAATYDSRASISAPCQSYFPGCSRLVLKPVVEYTETGERVRVMARGKPAFNLATKEEGNCRVGGCADSRAANFDEYAAFDDGSCEPLACELLCAAASVAPASQLMQKVRPLEPR